MTTASDDYPARSWKERWYEIAGHFGPMFEVFWLCMVFINQYFDGWQGWTITILVLVVIGMMGKGQFEHARNLCWRCMKIVPLAPEPEVKKYDRELRYTHWTQNNSGVRNLLILAIVLFIPLTASIVIEQVLLGGARIPPPWGALDVTGLFLFQTWQLWCMNIHQWLHPWCPYCKNWGNGGEHEEIPDPVPSGEKESV